MIDQICPKCHKDKFLIESYSEEFLIRCLECKTAIWLIKHSSLISISAKQWEAKAFLERFPFEAK